MNSNSMGSTHPDPSFDEKSGLIPAVVQDVRSGRVLMLGYMNNQALQHTRASGRVTFFSRSRGELWTKGERSGSWLELVELRTDCDGDALLVRAVPHGPTCHTGQTSCFGEAEGVALGEVLADLADVIESRKRERPQGSYTASLFEDGPARIARKVGEEALELGLELVGDGDRIAEEAADLLFHVLVLLAAADRTPQSVAEALQRRRSGVENR